MKKSNKIQANYLVMKSEFQSDYRKFSTQIKITEQAFFMAVQKKNKEEATLQATNYTKLQLKDQGYSLIQSALETFKNNIPKLSAAKAIPDSLITPMRTLCVAADIFKLQSFATFKGFIKSQFGNDVLLDLSDPNKLTPDFPTIFSDKSTFTQSEIVATIKHLAQRVYGSDLKPIEFLIGQQTPSAPNSHSSNQQIPEPIKSNSSSIQYQAPLSNKTKQQKLTELGPPPLFTPATMPHFPSQPAAVDYPKFPEYPNIAPPSTNVNQAANNQQNGIFYQELQNFGQMGAAVVNYEKNIHYPAHPDICYPMDMPVFSRTIWPTLSEFVNNAVA